MFSPYIRNFAREGLFSSFILVCEFVKIRPVRFSLAQKFRQNVLPRRIFSQVAILTGEVKLQGWSEAFWQSLVPYTEFRPSHGHSPDPVATQCGKTAFVKKKKKPVNRQNQEQLVEQQH